MNNSYVFEKTDTIVRHVIYRLGGYSTIRAHKTIYLLFAIYAGDLGIHEENPDYLFKEDFEAWLHGPVLRSLYLDSIEGEVTGVEWVPNTVGGEDFCDYIDSILYEINKLDDFQLVDRTHEDNAWLNAYIDSENPHNIGIMSKEDIRDDYR